jgi:GAF domain-containing protein
MMAHEAFSPELIDALQALEPLLLLKEDLESTLSKLSEVAVTVVSGCDSASVTLKENGEVRTPGASDGVATALDSEQYRADSGPCLTAIEEAATLVVDDLETDPRWPTFSKAATEQGIVSTLSVPIRIDGVSGGLNLYSRTRAGFRDSSSELTDLLASRASVAIENARIYGASRRLIEQLKEAIETRDIIGAAKGILMEREGVPDDKAFQMLVTTSQNGHLKLREVARRIVEQEAKQSSFEE